MKKAKQEKGITLIALIITIIVLLILAVVTIGAVQDSKIITYAQNAANDYNKEKDKEESTISGYENLIEQYVPQASRIEYYVMNQTVQKIDRINGIAIIYFDNNGEFVEGTKINFYEGEPQSGTTEIKNVRNNITGEIEEIAILPVGAIAIISNGVVGGYFSDNKLYGNNEGVYSVFELVTDQSELARIEAGISKINQ